MPNASSLAVAIDERVANQWIALGGQLEGPDERTPVDIEALVAITSDRQSLDARAREVAVDWCIAYGRTVHTGRLRSVARELGVDEARLAAFADGVAGGGGPVWPFAVTPVTKERRGKVVARDLTAPGRLSWRVRAAFGVNARADILTVLLSTAVIPISISDLTRRTRFTKKNVTLAVADMALAGIVVKTRVGREDRVLLERGSPLRALLEPDGIPSIDWATRWRVLRAVERVDRATRDTPNDVRLVETRIVAETQWPDLATAALPRPDLTATGDAWGPAFNKWMEQLAAILWMRGA